MDDFSDQNSLSDIDDSASELSKSYNSIARSQASQFDEIHDLRNTCTRKGDNEFSKYTNEYYDKFVYYRIFNGVKLPMIMGEKGHRFTISDLVRISTTNM